MIKDKIYFAFPPSNICKETTYIKVYRLIEFSHRDGDIGNRAYEKLIGGVETDDLSEETDAFFEMENITFEKVTKKEYNEEMSKATNVTVRGY